MTAGRVLRLAGVLALIAAVTLVCYGWLGVNATTAALVFLLAILSIAAEWGLPEAVFGSFAAVLCFNYFFLPPVGTFTIAEPQNWVALFAFLGTSIIASNLSAKAKSRADQALAGRAEMERLYELSRALLLSDPAEPVAAAVARHIARIFECDPECDPVAFFDSRRGEVFGTGVAKPNGALTVPVSLGGRSVGSLSVPAGSISEPAMHAIVNLSAIAIEREDAQALAARVAVTRQNEELKATLLDAVAHEFKTPLTSIKAAATAMLSSAPEGSPQIELLTIVNEEAERLNGMVTDAIQMARIEAGDFRLEPHPVSVPELLEETVASSAGFLSERKVSIEADAGLPRVAMDRETIGAALRQLLNNAAKYSPPGAPIRVMAEVREDALVVSVTDLGAGVAEAEQARIFDKFYRGRTIGGRIPGTGMGLAIAREIVEAHRGRIWLESSPGEGSRFSFSLPLQAAERVEN